MDTTWLRWIGVFLLSVVLYAGGKPSKGTPADQRLKGNKRPKPITPPKKG